MNGIPSHHCCNNNNSTEQLTILYLPGCSWSFKALTSKLSLEILTLFLDFYVIFFSFTKCFYHNSLYFDPFFHCFQVQNNFQPTVFQCFLSYFHNVYLSNNPKSWGFMFYPDYYYPLMYNKTIVDVPQRIIHHLPRSFRFQIQRNSSLLIAFCNCN